MVSYCGHRVKQAPERVAALRLDTFPQSIQDTLMPEQGAGLGRDVPARLFRSERGRARRARQGT